MRRGKRAAAHRRQCRVLQTVRSHAYRAADLLALLRVRGHGAMDPY